MTYVIALPCVDVRDRACVEECPVDCIYEGQRALSPGGAAKLGVIARNHPLVSALPPQGGPG